MNIIAEGMNMRPLPKTLTVRAASQPQGKPQAMPAEHRQLPKSQTWGCPPKASAEGTTISRSDFVAARDVRTKFYQGYVQNAAQITYLTKEAHAEACRRITEAAP